MTFTYNRVTLIGHAAAAPETRFTSGGQRVATLNLATDRPVRAGAPHVTDWHRIVCWDRLAEVVVDHVVKGRLLFIEGAITYRVWQDEQRQKHSTTEILARELILLDRHQTSSAHTTTNLAPAPRDENVEDVVNVQTSVELARLIEGLTEAIVRLVAATEHAADVHRVATGHAAVGRQSAFIRPTVHPLNRCTHGDGHELSLAAPDPLSIETPRECPCCAARL